MRSFRHGQKLIFTLKIDLVGWSCGTARCTRNYFQLSISFFQLFEDDNVWLLHVERFI